MSELKSGTVIAKTYQHNKDCVVHCFENGDVKLLKLGLGGQVVFQEHFTVAEFFDMAHLMLGEPVEPQVEETSGKSKKAKKDAA